MKNMKTFREFISENLSYKIKPEDVLTYKGIDNYVMTNKGDIMLYSDENTGEALFTLDTKKNRLTVLKQGWQLMNVKRGF
jgi:hypothetical protein